MSLLKPIPALPNFTPQESEAQPRRLISGAPTFRTWPLDEAKDGRVSTGIWEATPGESRSIKGETFEFCHVLSGLIEIDDETGATRRFGVGDSFVMKPGFVGVWRTIETVRKIYVTVN